jgi:hypothetical protein
MQATTPGTSAQISASPFSTLTLYRVLRTIAGPVLAYRLSFAWRAGK